MNENQKTSPILVAIVIVILLGVPGILPAGPGSFAAPGCRSPQPRRCQSADQAAVRQPAPVIGGAGGGIAYPQGHRGSLAETWPGPA